MTYPSVASTTNPTVPAANVDPNITADVLAQGGGLVANTGTSWNWNNWDTASTSAAAAVAAGDFWSWGFDVTGDVEISLATLDIRYDRSGTGPDDVEITVAVNGGAATVVHTHDFADNADAYVAGGIDLTGIAELQSLVQGDSVAFTLAAFNSESAAGTFDLEFHTGFADSAGIVINGALVPESTSLLLGSLGLLALLRRRR